MAFDITKVEIDRISVTEAGESGRGACESARALNAWGRIWSIRSKINEVQIYLLEQYNYQVVFLSLSDKVVKHFYVIEFREQLEEKI